MLLTLWSVNEAVAQADFFATKEGVIKGYDVVAYFTEGKASKGSREYQLDWQGEKWLFSSKENKELFQANPHKYIPQYNGYCAFGISKGEKFPIDPHAWAIVDGKLYLNYNKNVQKDWMADQEKMISLADLNWKKLTSK